MKFAIRLTKASLLCAGVAILTLCAPYRASAQDLNNLEVTGGYSHISGDSGLNGFNLSSGYWFNRFVTVNVDYDFTGNTSTLGLLSLTSAGHTAVRSRLQDWFAGPRVFFPAHQFKKYRFDPFAEFKIGASHLSERITQTNLPTQSASGTNYSWALGGGVDYQFTSQWFGRFNLDLMRTHFAESAQSRLRLVLGVGYTFGPRPTEK